MQFIHEEDVGLAFLRCVLGAGPPGAYNIAGDGVMTADDVARELGFAPLALPAAPVQAAARAIASLPTPPLLPPAVEWVEALSHPAIMDAGKAKRELGWKPSYTAREALRDTLRAP
jgi:nucleoside-diphosphate-sugar epimerase